MVNVLKFPTKNDRKTGVTREGTDHNDSDARRIRRAERAAVLRAILEKRPDLNPSDQVLVAENLWRLLDQYKTRGFKSQVLQTAGLANKEDSTKHLGSYAHNPAKPLKPTLRKTPKSYLKIIDAFVTLTGTDQNEALLSVFGDTAVASSMQHKETAPEFDELARALNDISAAVAAKNDLQTYFRAVARGGISLIVQNDDEEGNRHKLDADQIELGFSGGRSNVIDWPVVFREASDDAQCHDWSHAAPPYPAVLLGLFGVGDRFPVNVRCLDTPRDGEYGPFEGVSWGQYFVELRICIVPVGKEMRPEAALRIKINVSVDPLRVKTDAADEFEEDGRRAVLEFSEPECLSSKSLDFESNLGFEATVISSKRDVRVDLTADRTSVPIPISLYCEFDTKKFSDAKTCQFLPMTGPVLEDWLGIDGLEGNYWFSKDMPTHLRVLGEPLLEWSNTGGLSVFKAGTIAADLDHCVTGPRVDALDTILDRKAAELKDLLAEALLGARADREAQLEQLAARLRKMKASRKDEIEK